MPHAAGSPPPSRREAFRWALAALGTPAVAGSIAGCGTTQEGPLREVVGLTPADDGSGDLGSAAALPVDGATVVGVDGEAFAVARTSRDEVIAFDATCPHQDCVVRVSRGVWHCPCHDSDFDATTGAALSGPAAGGLTPRAVRVEAGRITLAD